MNNSVIVAFVIIIMVLLLVAVCLAVYALKLHTEQTKELNKLRRKLRIYEKQNQSDPELTAQEYKELRDEQLAISYEQMCRRKGQ